MPRSLKRPVVAALGREDRRLQRDGVADLPAVASSPAPRRRWRRCGRPRQALRCAGGSSNSGYRSKIVRADREVREEVLRVLVDAAEPRRVRRPCFTPGVASICAVEAVRQHLRDRQPRGDHQAVGAGDVAAGVERHAHRIEHPEQQERRDHRQQRQQRAGLAAEQRGPDQVQVFHRIAPPVSAAAAAVRPACPCRGAACASRTRRPWDRG